MKSELYQRVAALSPSQRRALSERLSVLSAPAKRLVAYVTLDASESLAQKNVADSLVPSVLKTALKENLPSYMLPAAIVPLADFPRTANGKIDVRALPAPLESQPLSKTPIAPRNDIEARLVDIWRQTLKLTAVGIHDNFFELGGDSILSIQIVSKAREAGLRIAPNQLFEYATIAELAAVVNTTEAVKATQDEVVGAVPLTPIQHWFFEQEMVAPQHWHQGLLLDLPPTTSLSQRIARVQQAIALIWRHHDALRLRFTKDNTGWQQVNASVGNPPVPTQIDLSGLTDAQQHQAVETQGNALHSTLDLANGQALQAIHFTRGENQSSWLLISLHHLVVDGISWRILQEDLLALLNPAADLQNLQLPAKTTAFKDWANILVAQSVARRPEMAFWLEQLAPTQPALPQDKADVLLSTEGTANTLKVSLEASKTLALLQKVPAVYNTRINDVLLTALSQTLLQWIDEAASKNASPVTHRIRLDVESHGREQLVADVDLSRTVGWFTAVYPVCLQLPSTADVGATLKSVKEQLRQIPDKGIGYGLLRYLGDDETRKTLASFSPSDVLFNYLGQREVSALNSEENKQISIREDIDIGELRNADNSRQYLLEINAWVSGDQLHVAWTYDTQRYRSQTIATVAQTYLASLNALISHCLSAEHGGFTPSDFPDVQFSQAELDSFLADKTTADKTTADNNIESLYPLAPLQQAFLWNSLQTSAAQGLLHMRATLHGVLDVGRWHQAWEAVIQQHSGLRSSVHWEGVRAPVQMSVKEIALPLQVLDWRGQEKITEKLGEFLVCDRTLGFDFTQAPIMRLTLIRLGETEYEMIWSCHHLMLDGWSGTLVINQVLAHYEALQTERPPVLSAAPSYQSYIRWLAQQDMAAAESFWRKTLAGFTLPTPVPVVTAPDNLPQQSVKSPLPLALSAAETASVQAFLKGHRLTLNTLIQATWALFLSLRSDQRDVLCDVPCDVLFGVTVSGRQADLAGVESIVGLLINVLPVRVHVQRERSIIDWLQALQMQQSEASQYAYASPVQVQSWSECSRRLFNSLLVIENYPIADEASHRTLQLRNLRSGIISTYDLTIIVKPGDVLTLYAEGQNADQGSLQEILNDLQALLIEIIKQPTETVSSIALAPSKIKTVDSSISTAGQDLPSTALASANRPLPSSRLELALTQIWESVLGVFPLSIDASFFDLGGDSLLAVQLFNKMQQQLGCSLPLASLFQAPTIRQFAALLQQSQSTPAASISLKRASLVAIQTHGSRRPLFFHGGSADALTWARFALLLGADQPFYALQRPDLDGGDVVHTTIVSLAAACIEEIRQVQPEGPYLLGGHCFGGAVVFEIAHQLQAQGETILPLIAVDAYCPNVVPQSPIGRLQEKLQIGYFLLRKSYYYHGGKHLIQLPQKVWSRLRSVVSKSRVEDTVAETTPASRDVSTARQSDYLPYEARYTRAHEASAIALNTYQPNAYSGEIQLFRAQVQSLDWRYGHGMGWQNIALGAVKVTNIPGLFGNLFNQESGPLLAQAVKETLLSLAPETPADTKARKLLQIVPRLPPYSDGVGDYSRLLAKQLFTERDIVTEFLSFRPGTETPDTIDGFYTHRLFEPSAEYFLSRLPKDLDGVILHYSNYPYLQGKLDAPFWLVDALRTLMRDRNISLVVMFHELPTLKWKKIRILNPIQSRLSRQLARLASAVVTDSHHFKDHLEQWTASTVTCIPDFSTIGEPSPEEIRPLALRQPRLVIFGGSDRIRAYRDIPQLRKTCQALGIQEICDIGAKQAIDAEALGAIKLTEMGFQPAETVQSLLLDSMAGLIDYSRFPGDLGKSSVFAAFCAHGVMPICTTYNPSEPDGIFVDQHYVLAGMHLSDWSAQQYQSIATQARSWYCQHSLEINAKLFSSYFP
ncbi:MAG: alpha/beta fold hydrolase [Cyanobacteria bacterium J06627_28]